MKPKTASSAFFQKYLQRDGERKGKQAFYKFKEKEAVEWEEKIFTEGISCGSLCACRALVPWLHFKAQVAPGAPSRAGLIITGLGPLKCLTNLVSPKRTD